MTPYKLAAYGLLILAGCSGESSTADDGGPGTSFDGAPGNQPDGGNPNSPDGSGSISGCGMASDLTRVDFEHDGRPRGAQVHLPSGYDGQPTGLVLNFHGRNSNAGQQQAISLMNADADTDSYIAAYPEGIGNTFNAGLCCGEAQSMDVDDVGFSRELVARLSKELCIDPTRIYATGLSNGGYMTQRLACEASDLFAGFASVAGLLVSSPCDPAAQRPIVHFHGTADSIVPYSGNGFLQSAADNMAEWAARNQCNTPTTTAYSQGDASCIAYDCPVGQEVEFCTIDQGGHTWPGGFAVPGLGKTSTDIDANRYMWEFMDGN